MRVGIVATSLLMLGVITGCAGDDAGAPVTSTPPTTAAIATSTTALVQVTTSTTVVATSITTVAETVAPASVAARPSPGCASDASVPGETMVTEVPSSPRTGRYHVVLPSTYTATTPMPLVLDLHGYQEGLEIHRMMSNLAATGERHAFIVVTPEVTNTVPRWDATIGSPDTEFLGAVLDEIEAQHCIDLNRVYTTGLSNGAFMTSVLGCQFSDRIAAIAPVAGLRDPEGCSTQRSVPVIAFHGTADTFVSYDGGLGESVANLPTDDGGTIGTAAVTEQGPSVEEVAAAWAARNRCASDPPVAIAVAGDVDLIAFDCPPDRSVELYRVNGGGHTWPGSAFSQQIESIVGVTTFSIDANELMWAFFEDHPLAP